MAKVYADEQFPRPVVEFLRGFCHDVLTVQESGNAGFSDPEIFPWTKVDNPQHTTMKQRHTTQEQKGRCPAAFRLDFKIQAVSAGLSTFVQVSFVPQVLEFAIANERAVLTQNRRDFKRLHRLQLDHAGIIICTDDRDGERLAARIDEAISAEAMLTGKLIP